MREIAHILHADDVKAALDTLFDLGPDEWLLFWHAPPYALYHRKRQVKGLVQLQLLDVSMQEIAVLPAF